MSSGDRYLAPVVAGTAGAVLFTEIVITRLLSVLLYYHYSFLAVSVALFGLAWGGLIAAQRPLGDDPDTFAALARRRLLTAAGTLAAVTAFLGLVPPLGPDGLRALTIAIVTAVPLALLGEVLARALALGRPRINRLYAVDLIASAGAALLAIPLLARVQGPAALAVPAVVAATLACLLASGRQRRWAMAVCVGVGSAVAWAAISEAPILGLPDPWMGRPVLERWNAYSRVRVRETSGGELELVIDRAASSRIPRVPRSAGDAPAVDPEWAREFPDPAYALGRTPHSVAVIGVGGGPDLLAALAAGARQVTGFELNGRIVDLLTRDLVHHNAVARRPEVTLVRDEARHALERSARRYDVIRASLIDTWASTAAGGFVLSENGLYTLEAWRLFLRRLTPSGVLAVTRWHLPASPAEAERLVALAGEALDAEGLGSAADRVIAIALPTPIHDPLAGAEVQTITALVSRTPFSAEEVARLEGLVAGQGGDVLLAPSRAPAPAAVRWTALLSPVTRPDAIRSSPWAIDPPRDTRPFFFLQLRPLDVLRLTVPTFGPVSAITMNGVQVLVASVLLALIGALLLLLQVNRWRRRSGRVPGGAALGLLGTMYFALIGIGYMAVQLGLHQRLAIVLGHPTPTLALVIAAMLLGTGLGSGAQVRGAFGGGPGALGLAVLAIVLLLLAFPYLGELSSRTGLGWTAGGAGALSLAMGFALGAALPSGIRTLAGSESGVAEAWAVNGAFSVVGASLGALAGLMLGSHALVGMALPCYVGALLILARHRAPPLRGVVP